MPVTHQRSIVAALTRVVRASAGASSLRGVSRHLTYSLPKSAKARHNFWLYDPQHESTFEAVRSLSCGVADSRIEQTIE
jgi:hypothetical protein